MECETVKNAPCVRHKEKKKTQPFKCPYDSKIKTVQVLASAMD